MLAGFTRLEIVPTPTGSNPLWLEKKDMRQKLTRYLSLIALILLLAGAVIIISDYLNAKDPNAFECNAGFANTGCRIGYKCVGNLVKCEETGENFKYRLTGLIFSEKKCRAAHIYKEYCVDGEQPAGK